MATTSLLLLAGLTGAFLLAPGPASCQVQPMDELCMGCICEAASKCDRARQCRNGICGLFSITLPYWQDAGKPVIAGDSPSRQGAFQRCVTEPFCAARTVQEYMTRYAEDCDGDGVITCNDYATMHHLGRGCQGQTDPTYRRDFQACQRKVNPGGK